MWCIPPKQDAAFVCAMEQVLEVYKRPVDAAYPVVCMDESSVQCIKENAVRRYRVALETLLATMRNMSRNGEGACGAVLCSIHRSASDHGE